ncbi:MAG: hypothetical protein D6812_09780 [Deltaproteobacteria bacterium]|nr:MAG: hypothetical protein D6812_09780 [Deltaproteobacteria bacterium]
MKKVTMKTRVLLLLLLAAAVSIECGDDGGVSNVDVSGTWFLNDVRLIFNAECGENLSSVADPVSFTIVVHTTDTEASRFEGNSEAFPFGAETIRAVVAGKVSKTTLTFTEFQFQTFGNSFSAPDNAIDPLTVTETSIPAFEFTATGTSQDTPGCILIAKIPTILISKAPGVGAGTTASGETAGSAGDESDGTGAETSSASTDSNLFNPF